MQIRRTTWLQLLRFTIGGIPGAVIYYGTMFILTHLGVWYVIAFTIAQITNSGLNFVIQKKWVFKDTDKAHLYRKIALHLLVSATLLLLSAGMIFVVREYLHVPYLLIPVVLVIPKTLLAYLFSRPIFTHH